MHQSRHDTDSYRRVEVITGERRRRTWSDEEKARIVAESADPDANISEIARRNGVSRGLLTVWRRRARVSSADIAPFARVRIEASVNNKDEASFLGSRTAERIEIEIAGATVRVAVALARLEQGNLSNAKGVGEGVLEYRIDWGPGYRVYFGRDGDVLVILLTGGTKHRQQRDIDAAKTNWTDYKRRKPRPK